MSNEQKNYQHIKIKKLAGSRVSLSGEITTEAFEQAFEDTVQKFRQNFEAPGFRKGHVPEKIFLSQVNQAQLLEEAAETALRRVYPEIIEDEKLQPLTPPQISITKLAPKNPMGFTAEFSVRPEAKLPDYKKIAKKVFAGDLPVELKEDEVEKFISQLLEMESQIRNRDKKDEEKTPVELTDEFVKQLGPFEGVEDFKTKIREDMVTQKKLEQARERREEFAKQLIEGSTIDVPEELVAEEFESSFNKILDDLRAAQISLEDYAKKLNKTEEEFKKEKRKQIEDQLKLRFLLEDIANLDNITPEDAEVEREVARVKKNYANVGEDQIRSYVRLVLRNEAVLRSLEEGEKPEK